MTAPAEQLRAAAAKLRDTAAKATPGPWEWDPDFYTSATSEGAVIAPHQIGWGRIVVDVGFLTEHRECPWIAMMSPAVAEPLAALLELAAELGERQAELIEHHVDGGPCRDTACRTVHAALAVARVILGEAP